MIYCLKFDLDFCTFFNKMQLRYVVFFVLYFWVKVLSNLGKSTFLTANFWVKVLSNLGKSTFLKSETLAIRGFEWGLKVFKSFLKV